MHQVGSFIPFYLSKNSAFKIYKTLELQKNSLHCLEKEKKKKLYQKGKINKKSFYIEKINTFSKTVSI